MASADQTFDLHGTSAEVPIVPVGGTPLLMDGKVGEWQFDITNPKQEATSYALAISTVGFSSDLVQSFVARRPGGAVWPGAGALLGAGATERVTITVTLSSPLSEGHEGGLRLVVQEV